MFYSHEILTNAQHGVATVWLVATVGKTGPRKINRKVIQGVNVPKACEKIIDPGAPLALRLQGNLLYGVSRVFSHQCNYVLSDAESVQSQMLSYFRSMSQNGADPTAGKTRRVCSVLHSPCPVYSIESDQRQRGENDGKERGRMWRREGEKEKREHGEKNDPNFDIMSSLPRLDPHSLDLTKDPIFDRGSQSSTQDIISQLTPLTSSQPSSASISANFSIDLPDDTSPSNASYCLPSDLGGPSPSCGRPMAGSRHKDALCGGDNDVEPLGGLGLDIDGDGNLIGVLDSSDNNHHRQSDLPSLPGTDGGGDDDGDEARVFHEQFRDAGEPSRPFRHHHSDVLIMGGSPLPDADALPHPVQRSSPPLAPQSSSSSGEDVTTAAALQRRGRRRGRGRRHVGTMMDPEIHIRHDEFRSWTENYVANMEALTPRSGQTLTSQARRNAYTLMYGNGIANVGATLSGGAGTTHPLAEMFAGQDLIANLLDAETGDPQRRNVRPRHDNDGNADGELGRGQDDVIHLDHDEEQGEIGVGPMVPLEDGHSSTVMPWSRAPSAVPGSSVRGSAGKHRQPRNHPSSSAGGPSPLPPDRTTLLSIERYSDAPVGMPSDYGDGDDDGGSGAGFPPSSSDAQDDDRLDASGRRFLGYLVQLAEEELASASVSVGSAADPHTRWVSFVKIADPETHTRHVAAQAFLHVLTLATRNVISVRQDVMDGSTPFGHVRIGVSLD
ncbi:N terminus of Rad21 / Rec8 like protein [Geosmithia morbida]|uniref:N terminus of Rad21 / Rec8 like protein n=1 Tax=Geosmithia morbida TaxID=1094350 RepID=A0A9P4YWP1_9HYPO|nr:N terminus of Rad21 / Rec8 like protein [Geosmithia morbida]KAF4124476.1 N terminus of Rad21 / Rec8 like protein [Geosmithia morbida]